jgi:hypothetical protein
VAAARDFLSTYRILSGEQQLDAAARVDDLVRWEPQETLAMPAAPPTQGS